MPKKLSPGFTLIEVLVTLVILTFGLLGIAGLMAKGQRIAFEAYQRQQATALAADMAERIRGNRFLAVTCPTALAGCTTYIAGAPLITPLGKGLFYNDYRSGLIVDCAVLACDQMQLALYDIALWDGLLFGYSEQQAGGAANANRYGGVVRASGCIEQIASTAASCPAPGSGTVALFSATLRVSVAWQGNDDTVAPVVVAGSPASCGSGLYGVETKRRIITYDVLLQELCPP